MSEVDDVLVNKFVSKIYAWHLDMNEGWNEDTSELSKELITLVKASVLDEAIEIVAHQIEHVGGFIDQENTLNELKALKGDDDE